MRFNQLYSRKRLVAMLDEVKDDAASKSQDDSIHIYNSRARKLINDITWAIYWHDAPQGNTRMQANKPQEKWW